MKQIFVLFSTIFYKVEIYFKELISHGMLNSAYSIKQISYLFRSFWLAIQWSHDHLYIIEFGTT